MSSFYPKKESDESNCASGPAPAEYFAPINFKPSGNCPEIDLGAPKYN
mgnify:CR=1 FL=1